VFCRWKRYFLFVVMAVACCFISGTIFAADIDFSRIVQTVTFEGVESKNNYLNGLRRKLNAKPGFRITENELVFDVQQLFVSGYFSSVDVDVKEVGSNQLSVSFLLKENPIIKKLLFRGNEVFSDIVLERIILSKSGDVLNLKTVQEDRELINKRYVSEGYVLSKLLSVDFEAQGTLVYSFSDPKINELKFQGLNRISPFVIQRELELNEGDVFNTRLLRQDRERLIQLGYFSDVSAPYFEESLDKEKVKVNYNFLERNANMINLGLEQDDEAFVGFIRGDLNHLLIPTDILSGKMQVGYEDPKADIRSYSIRYYQPWLFNYAPIGFAWDIWTEFKNQILTKDKQLGTNEVIRNKRTGTDVILNFPLIKNRLSMSTKALYEDISPYDDSLVDGDDGFFNEYQIRSLSLGFSYSSILKMHNPSSGSYWNIQYEQGGDVLGVDVGGLNFYRVKLEAATFFSVMKDTIFGIHAVGGLFNPFNVSGSDPIYTFEQEAFSIGGASSLRGYKDYFQINDKLFQLNLEFRRTLNDVLQTVIFWDMGMVYADSGAPDFSSLYHGFGIGLRFFTPLGPIRVDVAKGDALLIQFGVGQMF
jgi:outer membrane protein insertion porin family